jgi:AcrR family transcriptional regulator
MSGARQARGSARARLLNAADQLFYAHGIASTGVDAVIARAGVATASLYKNFAGKDDLVAAYLSARDQRWREHWESCIAELANPDERVLALFTAMRSWDAGPGPNRGCAHVAASLQLPQDHPGRVVAREHKRHVLERLGQLVAEASIPNSQEVTGDLMMIYEGMLSLLALDLDPDAIARAHGLARLRIGAQSSYRGYP